MWMCTRDVSSHPFRHRETLVISIDADDHSGAHHFRARCRTQSNRALREHDDGIANLYSRRFSSRKPGGSDVGEQHDLFVREFIRDLCEVGLCVGHAQILGLRAVDRISETPSTERFISFAVTALCRMARQACAALAARCDRADQHAFAELVARNALANLFNNADRFVTDHEARLDRIFTSDDVQVSSANRGEGHFNDDFTRSGARFFYLLNTYFVLPKKYICFHVCTSLAIPIDAARSSAAP